MKKKMLFAGAIKLAAVAVVPATLLVNTPVFAQTNPALDALYVGRTEPFRAKTLDQKVQELTDREEIRELTAVYAHRVARGVSIADLYTDDGAYIHRRPGAAVREVRGRAALDAYFKDRSGEAEHPMPMIHNHIIEINGDEARGICSNELRITENGKSMIASGFYEDHYRRENGRWRFVLRDVTFFHWVSVQEGWAKPALPR